eukprot:277494_1
MLNWWLFTYWLALQFAFSLETKFISVADLHPVASNPKHSLFKPFYSSSSGKETKHDVHIVDNNGKFMKLKYESRIPQHFNVIYLDEIPVENVGCGNNTNTVNITFVS